VEPFYNGGGRRIAWMAAPPIVPVNPFETTGPSAKVVRRQSFDARHEQIMNPIRSPYRFCLVLAALFISAAEQTGPSQDGRTTPAPADQVSTGDGLFIGNDRCITCHRKQAAAWSETRHAQAFERLPDSYRKFAACLECHSTGFGKPGGYSLDLSAEEALTVQSVGCEACHGPGANHEQAVKRWTAAAPSEEDRLLQEIKAAIVRTPTTKQCAACHKLQAHQMHPPFQGQPALAMLRDPHQPIAAASLALPPSPHHYSVKSCGSCHYSQYQSWRQETHSNLATKLPAHYANELDCLRCHRTPANDSDWYAAASEMSSESNKLGVGCETCHGPAAKHVLFNQQNISGRARGSELVEAAGESIRREQPSSACLQCHLRDAHLSHPEYQQADAATEAPSESNGRQ
jgi:hypothetical protein